MTRRALLRDPLVRLAVVTSTEIPERELAYHLFHIPAGARDRLDLVSLDDPAPPPPRSCCAAWT